MNHHAKELHRFIVTPKPDWCSDADVIVTAYLLAIADVAGNCSPTQIEICRATGVTPTSRTLRESLRRLHEHGWITWLKLPRLGVPNSYEVHFEKLPRKEEHEQTR